MRFQTYTVQNTHGQSFPLGMLWAEQCFPLNQSDVAEIQESQVDFCRHTVTLGRWVKSSRKDRPLCKRWESHGWKVLDCQTR